MERSSASATLAIEGMSCKNCVAHVEEALAELPGLETATVDLASKQAHVRFDPAALSVERIVEAIEALDYQATPLA
ncbi:heavy-metal-associated domain-containing protein [bacterium]|nr:heavy-metal-associated domain-containing protein [bacterium]